MNKSYSHESQGSAAANQPSGGDTPNSAVAPGLSILPKQLHDPEFRFTLIKPGTKEPLLKKWQTNGLKIDDHRISNYIRWERNIGILGGYGGLFVIDADMKIISDLLVKHFPGTFTIKSRRGYHHYFKTDKAVSGKLSLKHDGKSVTYADLTYFGRQVVTIPSIHETGYKYKIGDDLDIEQLDYDKFLDVFEKYITKEDTAVLPKHYTNEKTNSYYYRKPTKYHKAIMNKLTLRDVMEHWGFDTSKHNTECLLHNSKSKTSFCWNDTFWHCWGCPTGKESGGNAIDLMRVCHEKLGARQ